MRTTLRGRLALGRQAGRIRFLILTVLMVAVIGAPLTADASAGSVAQGPGSPSVPGSSGPSGNGPSGAGGAGRTHQVTLLTGDVVVLHSQGGRQTAWVQEPANAGSPPAVVYQRDGQVHVVPAEALPYVTSGALDGNLFNITLLVRQGYDDETRTRLPMLLQGRGNPSTRRAPAVPSDARKVRELDSVGMVSVTAGKADIRSVWTALRGPNPAAVTAANARLAGAGKVWLNGTARATLEDSVAQIGAPEAWAAGYDGTGAQVAVLDTGYDSTHPDLADRVVEARNFTTDEEPAGETAVDGNGHGTHVAATVAGSGAAAGEARKGVAPGADLLIGKVLDRYGEGTWDQIIAGMEWAAGSGADVVNMSLGTPFPTDGTDPLSQAVNQLTVSTGTLFVVAAGNSGPGEQTVAAPGAADLALTVGAVTKQDEPAWFSSRGPRVGDMAIKPEVVAPGVGIIAARAAGTSLGNLIDENYTSLNGTSMATPHVAGAAAILAQQHDDWDADELKARLVASSKTLAGEPVTFQGGGRVDVAAAVRTSVLVDDAVLSLGSVPHNSAPVTRTLTYANPSSRVVRLRMSADVSGTGADATSRPNLAFSPHVLTVPAGGQASVDVRLAPRLTETGGYAGRIVAKQIRGPAVRSVMSFTVDGPLRTVTVNALDRAGQPASGSVDLWSAETGDWQRLWLRDGTATAEVPDGLYTLMATIQPSGSSFFETYQTIAGRPDLTVRKDVTVNYDARNGQPIRIDTPQEADLDSYHVLWRRSVGDRSFWMHAIGGIPGQRAYVIPSPRVRNGSFAFVTHWQLAEPMLTARTSGPDGFRIAPNPQFASLSDPFVGQQTMPVVYAGLGTSADYAAVDAAGKIALVTRSEQGLWQQVQAAKEEGVALLLVHNNEDGIWTSTVWRQGLPTYRLDLAAGTRLREALEEHPGLTLDVAGVRDSTYTYELAFPASGQLPRDTTYDVAAQDLAAIESDYRENSSRMSRVEGFIPYIEGLGVGNLMSMRRNGPVVRTEYVTTTDGVEWQRFAQPHGEFPSYYWTWSAPQQYRPGQTSGQVWWGPLVHPAVVSTYGVEELGSPVARFRDAIRIMMPHYWYGGSLNGTIYNQFGDVSELTLSSGGEVIGKAPWPEAQFTVPADEAEYELRLAVRNGRGNFTDTSTRTDTTWTFRSARTAEERTVLPLVQLAYGLDTNAYNEVPAGGTYPLVIKPGYQPGASGPGDFTVSVEVSYDDGTTWSAAPVDQVDGGVRAEIPAATAPGFATVRVVATDSAGNRLDQRIDRAWRIAAHTARQHD